MRSLLEDDRPNKIEIGPNGMSLDLLQACYRNQSLDLPIRIRCAMACLPFESPKLAVTAVVIENDIATLLDKRIAKLQEMEQQKLIEARPTPTVEVKPPLPRLPDRRYRRI